MISQEISFTPAPDRIVARTMVGDVTFNEYMANQALDLARSRTPKVSGATARSLQPIFSTNYFGIYFDKKSMWYLEKGISPFTMNSLAGKTIPMWIDDPTGTERRANPKAKVRTTQDGRVQVLIFRRAAKQGARKQVTRKINGVETSVNAPASYPGAPGRIGRRNAGSPFTAPGKVAGAIATNNVGVRWRHPGTQGRNILNSSITDVMMNNGIDQIPLYLVDSGTFYNVERV